MKVYGGNRLMPTASSVKNIRCSKNINLAQVVDEDGNVSCPGSKQ